MTARHTEATTDPRVLDAAQLGIAEGGRYMDVLIARLRTQVRDIRVEDDDDRISGGTRIAIPSGGEGSPEQHVGLNRAEAVMLHHLLRQYLGLS